jgi:hypothetical protein
MKPNPLSNEETRNLSDSSEKLSQVVQSVDYELGYRGSVPCYRWKEIFVFASTPVLGNIQHDIQWVPALFPLR